MKKQLTSNQLYGGLNRRFDRRVGQLRRLGFVYEIVRTEYDPRATYAILTRGRHGRAQIIPASTIMLADNRVYRETVLAKYLR